MLFNSTEYTSVTRTDEQYVRDLYEVYLQRAPDEAGLAQYTAAAGASGGRASVLDTFAGMTAFRELAGTIYREVNWLVTDHLGTPRMVVDRAGTLGGVKRHDYLPFGEEIGVGVGGRTTNQGYSGNDGVRQKFTGQERDTETGLDFMQARYYGATMGRFTSPDTFGGRLTNPQTLNLYAYVLNNPLKYNDPTGHLAQDPQKVKETGEVDENGEPIVEIVEGEGSPEEPFDGGKNEPIEMSPSWYDHFPVYGEVRRFGFERQMGRPGRALFHFGMASFDGGTFGFGSLVKSFAKGVARGAAIRATEKAIVKEALAEADVAAGKVLADSNVVPLLKSDPTAGGRILGSEEPLVSYVTGPELRNAVSTGNLRGVPGNLGSLDILSSAPSLNLRINIRGTLPSGRGRFGDGIIGAQTIESGLPLITNDRALANSVRALGGTVR